MQLEVADIRMPRFSVGVARKDKIRNDHIRRTLTGDRLGQKGKQLWLR